MSSAFPAMITDEPPPLDSGDEDDNEDYIEFRSGGLKLDVITDPSPLSSPVKLPSRNELHITPINTSSQDSPVHVNGETPSPCQENTDKNDENEIEVENYLSIQEVPNPSANPEQEQSCRSTNNNSDENLTEFKNLSDSDSSEHNIIFEPFSSSIVVEAVVGDTVENEERVQDNSPNPDGDEDLEWIPTEGMATKINSLNLVHNDDDSLIQSQHQTCSETIAQAYIPNSPSSSSATAIDFAEDAFKHSPTSDFKVLPVRASDDGCESPSDQDEWKPFEDGIPASEFPAASDFDDDDFGDFASSGNVDASNDLPQLSSVLPPASIGIEESIVIIKSLFGPTTVEPCSRVMALDSIDTELKNETSNKTWAHVREFEDSYGLVFKWANSSVYQHLLRSLNVDPATLLYSGKWGTIEVPKFAASLVDTPLLPQTSIKPSQGYIEDFLEDRPGYNSSSSQSPGADSLNSGTGDPEDDKLDSKYNKETTKILEQLPDLSYMRAKTLVFPRNPKY